MAAIPFLKGKNVTLTFLLAGENAQANNLVVRAKTFNVKPNGVDIADDILGEPRSDIDYELNYFEIMMTTLVRDLKLLRAALKHQEQRDLQVAMADSAVGVVIKPNDGTREAFQLRGFVLGGWELNIGGRTDRVEMPFPGRAKFFEPLAIGP